MKLYHGSNVDFSSIDLLKSNPYKDFGKGFYLTDIKYQAEQLAVKKCKLFGGKEIVQEYEFNQELLRSDELKVLIFEKPTQEWAEFIFLNRNRATGYKHDYDIVVGPIADDGGAYLLSRYEEGTLSIEDLSSQLTYKELNRQYFFGTDNALKHLRRI